MVGGRPFGWVGMGKGLESRDTGNGQMRGDGGYGQAREPAPLPYPTPQKAEILVVAFTIARSVAAQHARSGQHSAWLF